MLGPVSDLFIDGLFVPGVKINPDYKNKYLHILAYATTVAETYKKVSQKYKIFQCVSITYRKNIPKHTTLYHKRQRCSTCENAVNHLRIHQCFALILGPKENDK